MKYFVILLLSALTAFCQPFTMNDPAWMAQQSAGGVAPGIVGQIFAEPLGGTDGTLPANWTATSVWAAYQTNSTQIYVQGSTNLAGKVTYSQNAFQTCSENWEIRWSESNLTYNAATPGTGVGVYGINNNRSYFGIFTSDNGTDGRKATIYKWQSPSSWSLLVKSAQVAGAYSPGDIIDCVFSRTNDTLIFTCTNRTTGLGQKATQSFIYTSASSGTISPGPATIGLWAYEGSTYIWNLTMTNPTVTPIPLLVVGDSIGESYVAGSYYAGWAGILQTNKTYRVANYSGASGCVTNMLYCTNELKAYRASKMLFSIGGNDRQFGISEATTEANYALLVGALNGSTIDHALPTARAAINLLTWMQYLTNTYPNNYIDFWSITTNGSAANGLIAAYDSGDGVHPNAAGHEKMFETVTNSPLITP